MEFPIKQCCNSEYVSESKSSGCSYSFKIALNKYTYPYGNFEDNK